MLKPKYVHGLNADEAPKSLLLRLQNEGALQDGPADDLDDDLGGVPWIFIFG